MKRFLASAVVLFFVTSCATPSQQAKTEGTVAGGLLGAALGAASGGLIGRDAKSALIGALVGGAIGAAAGYSYAAHIAKRQQELASRENDLDARIKFARGVNEDTQEYNRHLEEDLNASTEKVDTLIVKRDNQQVTQRALDKEKRALAAKVKDYNEQVALAEKQLQEMKNFRAQQTQTSGELDAEIVKLEETVAKLKNNTNALASLSQRI